jgi:hypothetical protein
VPASSLGQSSVGCKSSSQVWHGNGPAEQRSGRHGLAVKGCAPVLLYCLHAREEARQGVGFARRPAQGSMADRACSFERDVRAHLPMTLKSAANYRQAGPSVSPLNLFLPLALSSITTSPTQHSRRRWFWPSLRRSVPRFRPAPLALGSPLILNSPLSTLHTVVLGPLPGVHGHHPALHHCSRYPLAFDLIYFAYFASPLYLYPTATTRCATPSIFISLAA